MQAIRDALNAHQPVQRRILNYRKDGRELLYQVQITPVFQDGALHCFIGIQQDVTLLHQTQLALKGAALTDGLTGLGNRRAFDVKLEWNQEAGEPFALVVADLDNLKQVNDLQGHIAGDRLIQLVAQKLTDLCGPGDQAFRLGGDEFAVLVGSVGAESLATRTAKWQQGLDELRQMLSVSVGTACFPEDHGDVWEVFREADRKMYAHKGRSR